MTSIKLKTILTSIQKNDDVLRDKEANRIINKALKNLKSNMDLSKVVFRLNQALDQYSLTHGFKLSGSLIKLKIALNDNADKWKDAGITGTI